jgi:hypothetical protein
MAATGIAKAGWGQGQMKHGPLLLIALYNDQGVGRPWLNGIVAFH